MLPRTVRNAPSDSLTTLPRETSSTSRQWERDISGPEFEMSEPVSDDNDEDGDDEDDEEDENDEDGNDSGYNYTDDEFEEYISEDDESQDSTEESSICIDIGNGIKLITSQDADVDIRVEPLLAEIRTDILKTFRHHNDEILASDAFGVLYGNQHLMTDMQLTFRVPVVIPSTRLDVSKLLRFHAMVKTKDGWKEISAEYKNHVVEFTAKNPQLFLVYARPIPEFYRVTAGGRTIVSDKDDNIQIEVPEGAVEGETYMRVRVNPIDINRIARYREHDPSAFEGILALTDILSLSHTMDRVFSNVAVQLPMNQTVDGEHEVRYYNINENQYSHIGHTVNTSQQRNVNMTCAVGPNTRCQAVCVQPGVSEEDAIRAAMFGAEFIHQCSVLVYTSKFKGDRFLTVEVVSSNNAEKVSSERLKKGFYEVLNSRAHIEVNNSERIRVTLSGNIEAATEKRKTKFAFLYSAISKNNWIQFKTRKSGSGTPYCIIIITVGARRVHEVHFDYPDAGKKLAEIKNLYHPHISHSILTPNESIKYSVPSVTSSDTGYRTQTPSTSASTSYLDCNTHASASPAIDRSPNTANQVGESSTTVVQNPSTSGVGRSQSRHCTRNSQSLHRSTSTPAQSDLTSTADGQSADAQANNGRRWSESSFTENPSQHRHRPQTAQTRPETASTDSTVHPDAHLFSQKSFLKLSQIVTKDLCQKVLLFLDFNYDKLMKTQEEAKRNDTDPVFLSFLRWHEGVSTHANELADDFIKAFVEHGRNDIAKAIKRARRHKRHLTQEDVQKYS